ncbi:MAG: DegT/DnrJ/EryC1/StrS family aminotransferase [Opitutaceae bacterium]
MLEVGEPEIRAMARVLRSGKLFRYHPGGEAKRFEEEYATYLGGKYVQLSASGTTALTSALASLGIGPGDEVIVPAHTYLATAMAVIACGAIPVIVDIDASITLDPMALEKAIGPRTRAVIPVHMWGLVCDMKPILRIARKHKILVIEDCCQCIGGSYQGRMVGSLGNAGVYSFNYFKNITCGEGGAVLSKTRRAHERVVMHTDACGFFWEGKRSEPSFCASSARISEIEGAMLRAQLKRLPGFIRNLRRNKARILEGLAGSGLMPSPVNDPDGECATFVFFQFPSEEQARAFASLTDGNQVVDTGRHTYHEWEPILAKRGHIHPALDPFKMEANRGCRTDYHRDMCPVSLDILRRTVMLGNQHDAKAADLKRTVDRIRRAAGSVL